MAIDARRLHQDHGARVGGDRVTCGIVGGEGAARDRQAAAGRGHGSAEGRVRLGAESVDVIAAERGFLELDGRIGALDGTPRGTGVGAVGDRLGTVVGERAARNGQRPPLDIDAPAAREHGVLAELVVPDGLVVKDAAGGDRHDGVDRGDAAAESHRVARRLVAADRGMVDHECPAKAVDSPARLRRRASRYRAIAQADVRSVRVDGPALLDGTAAADPHAVDRDLAALDREHAVEAFTGQAARLAVDDLDRQVGGVLDRECAGQAVILGGQDDRVGLGRIVHRGDRRLQLLDVRHVDGRRDDAFLHRLDPEPDLPLRLPPGPEQHRPPPP